MRYTDTTTPKVLAYMLTTGVFCVVFYILMWPVPEPSQRMLDMVVGSILTAWIASVMFFVGTSSSSATKTSMMQHEPVEVLKPVLPAETPKPVPEGTP